MRETTVSGKKEDSEGTRYATDVELDGGVRSVLIFPHPPTDGVPVEEAGQSEFREQTTENAPNDFDAVNGNLDRRTGRLVVSGRRVREVDGRPLRTEGQLESKNGGETAKTRVLGPGALEALRMVLREEMRSTGLATDQREAGERSIRLSFDVSEETKRRKDARRLPIKAVARLVRERVWLSAGVDDVDLIVRPFRHLDRTRVFRAGALVDVMNWQGFAVDVDEGVLTPTVRELAVESRKTERRLGQYRKENRLKRSGGRTDDEREAEA